MRRLAHQLAIFKSTGFAFVRITYQITRYALWLGQETPFQSRGEAGTASSPKARFLDFFQHILRTNALEGLLNGCITSLLPVTVHGVDAGSIAVLRSYLHSHITDLLPAVFPIGRASCRDRVCEYV